MKIAIVGPSPVPFTIGGIENLMWGLCDTINQKTSHQCELIKLPSKELSFWDLIETYYSFYTLDVSHFDMVIYTKYPGWMVQHPNGICYMAHCLRGLYDTYHLMQLPIEVPKGNPEVDRILQYMECYYCPDSLDDFFAMLFEMKRNQTVPQTFYAFPGPLIRRIIHYLDRWGLSQRKTKQYFSISRTVQERKAYFPMDAKVTVVYPPSTLKNYSTADYKYIFMVSRLDKPKRIDMLIQAMKYVKSDVKLLIAGTGPERTHLEELADGDERIQFLGFVKDEEVEDYYSNSLVIPYFPYDEDYGLITIEAMLHKKPVITTKDAGGPTEFVLDNETGYVVPFEEQAIAEKIDYFAQNPQEAKRMGENAFQTVKDITWDSVIEQIFNMNNTMEDAVEHRAASDRKKITVTSTFPITPPQGGGQARIYNLYKHVANEYDVEIVSFTGIGKPTFSGDIAEHMREVRIPISKEQFDSEIELQKEIGVPITDIAMILYADKTTAYGEALKQSIEKSDLVVLSHPYLYNEVKKYIGNRPFIYEAHNVEYYMKKAVLPDTEATQKLVQIVFDLEAECCQKSRFIMTCSEEDRVKLHELYHVPMEKMIVVPNGVDTTSTAFTTLEERIKQKTNENVADYKMGLFMGSWHGPNLEACETIFQIAKKCPEDVFLLMGSQCNYFIKNKDKYEIPMNVGFLGLVSEEEKNKVFQIVDFALNPMQAGSGTNLKMFDYMATGIPVITTSFGARGIAHTDGLILAETEEMAEVIQKFQLKEQKEKIEQARKTVQEEFDWGVICRTLLERIGEMDW